MINFCEVTEEKTQEHIPHWPLIYTFVAGVSRLEKTNALLNLINHQQSIDKMFLYTKDPYQSKYQYLLK